MVRNLAFQAFQGRPQFRGREPRPYYNPRSGARTTVFPARRRAASPASRRRWRMAPGVNNLRFGPPTEDDSSLGLRLSF